MDPLASPPKPRPRHPARTHPACKPRAQASRPGLPGARSGGVAAGSPRTSGFLDAAAAVAPAGPPRGGSHVPCATSGRGRAEPGRALYLYHSPPARTPFRPTRAGSEAAPSGAARRKWACVGRGLGRRDRKSRVWVSPQAELGKEAELEAESQPGKTLALEFPIESFPIAGFPQSLEPLWRLTWGSRRGEGFLRATHSHATHRVMYSLSCKKAPRPQLTGFATEIQCLSFATSLGLQ